MQTLDGHTYNNDAGYILYTYLKLSSHRFICAYGGNKHHDMTLIIQYAYFNDQLNNVLSEF